MERNVEINSTKRRSEVRKTCLKKRLENIFGEFCKDNSMLLISINYKSISYKEESAGKQIHGKHTWYKCGTKKDTFLIIPLRNLSLFVN